MSSSLYRLGQRCAHHPWRVVGVGLLIAAIVLGIHSQLGDTTKDNFTVPAVEAHDANDILDAHLPEFAGISGQMVFHVDAATVADSANVRTTESTVEQVRRGSDVTVASNPFDAHAPSVSVDGRTTFSTVYHSVDALDPAHTEAAQQAADLARAEEDKTEFGGWLVPIDIEGNKGVGLPVAVLVLLLLFAFGSLPAEPRNLPGPDH